MSRAALLTACAILGAGLASPSIGHAFDCSQIDATAQKAYSEARARMRKEITKSPSEGGAFSTPAAPNEMSCATQIYDAIGGFGGFSFGGAIDGIIAGQVNKACDRARDKYSDEMERLGTAFKASTISGSVCGSTARRRAWAWGCRRRVTSSPAT